jgi:N-acetylmuramoyl-L-alanine amidase
MIDRPSPNFDDRRGQAVELVVLHYTGMQSAEIALARLTDPAPVAGRYPGPWQAPDIDPATPLSRVSCHYVIGEGGEVWRLVDEQARAWHAGAGAWEGREDVNSRSIGIEIVNGGHDFGLPPYPPAQVEAVIALLRGILSRHGLAPDQVIGHSDLAPARKADPGEHFPWARLAEAGVAFVTDAMAPVSVSVTNALAAPDAGAHAVQDALAAIGYAVAKTGVFDETTTAAFVAFQRRFRPETIQAAVDEAGFRRLLAAAEAAAARRMLRPQR